VRRKSENTIIGLICDVLPQSAARNGVEVGGRS
jgi:hypothetical protein